ncbi:hypothetical protein ACN28S_35325 [Cystobacter fuscus]
MPQENGSGGPRGGRGPGGAPGQGPRRDGPGGFSFGDREGGRGGGGRGRGRDRSEGPVGPAQRIIADLSVLEKALGKSDLSAEKQPLESIVRSLRALRAKSLDDLDLNVRGRLITTLLRVQRQTKPPAPEATPAAEAGPAPAATEAPAEAAPAEGQASPAASGEGAEAAAGGAPAAPAVDPAKEKFQAYTDVLYLVGRAGGPREIRSAPRRPSD